MYYLYNRSSVTACGGHLAALQWAKCQGCPWQSVTCSVAAAGDQLAVLQWANRSQGCPWDDSNNVILLLAAAGGLLEVFK